MSEGRSSIGAGEDSAPTLSEALAEMLLQAGASHAFGVVGGTIAALCEALARTSLRIIHCRHETGAAFAAADASFVSNSPAIVFTTSGPSLANAINGLIAARWEGAKIVLLSGTTPVAQRGKWAFQETSPYTMPEALFKQGSIFHFATELQDGSELPEVARRLRMGFARDDGFVAHIALPSAIQTRRISLRNAAWGETPPGPTVGREAARSYAAMLAEDPFFIWLGYGARRHSTIIREFAERTGAPVVCSPRGRGIFPEDHPQFVGVSGMAGHASVRDLVTRGTLQRALVLGTKLGEFTSLWDRQLIPAKGVIHVDLDREVPGTAFPEIMTHAVQGDVGEFLRSVAEHLPPRNPTAARVPLDKPRPLSPDQDDAVRPQVLMQVLQEAVINGTQAPVLVDCGNSSAWATHFLRLREPSRLRLSSQSWGSMGHAASGVVGAALASGKKCVALVGDGAMLMQNEVSTAVQYRARAVWIVLNDSQYGMIEQGMRGLRMKPVETQIPRVDFVGFARSLGANGIAVANERELEHALTLAMNAEGPFVVDVTIDRRELVPMGARVKNLIDQGVKGSEGTQ